MEGEGLFFPPLLSRATLQKEYLLYDAGSVNWFSRIFAFFLLDPISFDRPSASGIRFGKSPIFLVQLRAGTAKGPLFSYSLPESGER
ncbi:hypothetical protein SAY87_014615 [Trapa incisa]|uniref:Uncharacterized protein n=1 Tax=Trapa incisa TaxID=236973 RepID=A0AAN7JKJ0_9MYRT|nr:hypothetical protein SAY87_014615 [Trapa incisa]